MLELGFPQEQKLFEKQFVLRAKDGSTVPVDGAKLYEPGAYIAFEDTEAPAWETIGQQRANPGPFYLIWANKARTNLEAHPRPYQLATIEIAKFEDVFPFTVPKGADEAAEKGFATRSRRRCRARAQAQHPAAKAPPRRKRPTPPDIIDPVEARD